MNTGADGQHEPTAAGSQAPSPGARRSPWSADGAAPRGASYDERWAQLAARGAPIHGEADLVAELAPGRRVLDAGCGTGRVAIELHRRGFTVAGVDLDEAMLAQARRKAPGLRWEHADLSTMELGVGFDTVVLAGNVLIFVDPGTEAATVARCADHLSPGGVLVAGFQVRPGGYDPTALDGDAEAAGLALVERWSTWDRDPWRPRGDYQVSVHRRR